MGRDYILSLVWTAWIYKNSGAGGSCYFVLTIPLYFICCISLFYNRCVSVFRSKSFCVITRFFSISVLFFTSAGFVYCTLLVIDHLIPAAAMEVICFEKNQFHSDINVTSYGTSSCSYENKLYHVQVED